MKVLGLDPNPGAPAGEKSLPGSTGQAFPPPLLKKQNLSLRPSLSARHTSLPFSIKPGLGGLLPPALPFPHFLHGHEEA